MVWWSGRPLKLTQLDSETDRAGTATTAPGGRAAFSMFRPASTLPLLMIAGGDELGQGLGDQRHR